MLNNKLVKKAFRQEWIFRNATQKELLKLKKQLQKHIKKSRFTVPEIKTQLLEKLEKDKKLIIALNKKLKDFPASAIAIDPTKSTYHLKFNKMVEILEGAIEFTNTLIEPFIESIKTNQELAAYHIKTTENNVTIMANDGPTIYGTSKGNIFKTVLINTELIYSGKNYLSEIRFDESWFFAIISFFKKCLGINNIWIDKSPNVQITPLPEKLNPHYIKVHNSAFTQCSYYYSDQKTPNGLAYVHSGYAFGAYHNDVRYPYPGKPFGPEDCSSWIGKLTGIDELSTTDLWNRWKYKRDSYTVPQAWENTATAQSLINYFIPLEISNTKKDIQPGLVWAMRSFDVNLDPDKKGNGEAGHTVLTVEGINEIGKVKGIGYSRNIPTIEGFGLNWFPTSDESNKRIMFFKVAKRHEQIEEQLEITNRFFDLYPNPV